MKKRNNGEGSIFFNEKRQRWVGSVTIAKGKRKTVYGKTMKEVREKMLEIKSEVANGMYCDKTDLTVKNYIQQLIDNDKAFNLIKETTYSRKQEILNKIKTHYIADMPIQSVRSSDIDDFLKGLTIYSDSLIRKEYALLKRCFNEAIPEIIKTNPMSKIKCPKSSKKFIKTRALTISEQKQLNSLLNSENSIKYKTQMLLMLNTGMRMGEINALSPEDVNLTFNTINIRRTITKNENDIAVIGAETKTDAGKRLIPISATVQAILKEYLTSYVPNGKSLLFYDCKDNMPLSTNQVNMEFKRICKKYDIIDTTVDGKVSLHSLRHTYATRCIESGMSAKVLQTLLGHTDIKITMNTYCDAFDEFKTEDISKLDEYLKKKLS